MAADVGPCSHWCYTGSEKLRLPFNTSLYIKLNGKGQYTTHNKTRGCVVETSPMQKIALPGTAQTLGELHRGAYINSCLKNSSPIWAMFAHSVRISGFIFNCTPTQF